MSNEAIQDCGFRKLRRCHHGEQTVRSSKRTGGAIGNTIDSMGKLLGKSDSDRLGHRSILSSRTLSTSLDGSVRIMVLWESCIVVGKELWRTKIQELPNPPVYASGLENQEGEDGTRPNECILDQHLRVDEEDAGRYLGIIYGSVSNNSRMRSWRVFWISVYWYWMKSISGLTRRFRNDSIWNQGQKILQASFKDRSGRSIRDIPSRGLESRAILYQNRQSLVHSNTASSWPMQKWPERKEDFR